MNKTVLYNNDWEFSKSDLSMKDSSTLSFQPVDLPHDWQIYNTLNLYENSIGWYRKKLTYTKEDADQVLLSFDGVYMDSSLYVNEQFIGEWKYGYSAFEHDITDALVVGENEVLLKVVFQSPNSRWYPGAGIYRNVWLKTRTKNHIETDGIYISTTQAKGDWNVEIDTELSIDRDAQLTHTILYQDEIIATTSAKLNLNSSFDRQTITVESPLLWDTNKPNLYQMRTELSIALDHNDSYQKAVVNTQQIGFRTFKLDPNRGFILNGKHMKLNGVCEHHDLGALGAAFNVAALKRRLVILKEMGVNAIRTAHNMPAKELMYLADEMGFMVVTEAFDMWERPKTTYDYARFFKEWAYRDVESWIKRDRNHPSLIMWSIGNEIYDTHADERGQALTQMLMEYVKEFDPKENAVVTIGSNYMPWENAQKCADIVKVAGYNYGDKYYHQHHAEHPDWIIYGSETASTVQSRGIYHFPFEKSILADDDEQGSSLGNSATSWGAKSTEACIIAERDSPFSLGQFIWTGFDYIGEPTPYHTKNSYLGQIDTATFPKDSYYIYQASWTNYKVKPMVHIFPYWDFNKGQMIDVRVSSNAPTIELFHNGVSMGTFDTDLEHGKQLTGWWKIPYEKGEIKAIAYDETGKVIATDVQRSFGDAKNIVLNSDKQTLIANGTDLIFVEIEMEDENGIIVENANNRVEVTVSGAGRLVGLDNGDSTDYDAYKGTSRRLFSGKLMAIIAAKLEPGKIQMEVSSNGLKSSVIEMEALPTKEKITGISAMTENMDYPIVTGKEHEIPVRKIEISSEATQVFDETTKEINVNAILHPANTSYQGLEWSVVTDEGIASNIAKIESFGSKAKVTALGDGEFRVRCTSKNGTDKTKLISELEFKAVGLGTAYKDPYAFISAGLYDYSKGDLGNGNDRGVATSRDGETQVGFREIDFGTLGSDLITIPIFALSSEEYSLQIWKGMPEEKDSELLADVIYQKESKWNTYQEETYQLSKKLTGITSICFVLKQKVHIKGFSFEEVNRAFEQNMATDNDHIYGDTYEIKDNTVEGIGNNVSLIFEDLNFTEQGVNKLIVFGQSPIDKNTIHVRFSNEHEEINQVVEFNQSEGYEERVFDLEKITGKQTVTFVFLPGSNFNFGWFRFRK